MKKKFLNCFLTAVMTMGLFVCPVSAETEDITIDVTKPVQNPDNLTVADGKITFGAKNGQYIEYDIDVLEAGSYYVNFNRENIDSGNFYMAVTVNGETVNRRTGRIKNENGSFTFQDEVWLEEGTNTVRIANMSNNDGTVSDVSFTKLSEVQYTTSMNSSGGGRTFKDSYKQGLAVDPWLWINDDVASYPDGEDAPYITFDVNIPREGYYSPAVAVAGADKVNLSIADESFYINDNCVVLGEAYKASGSASCSWNKSKDSVYLEAGDYEVTVKLYGCAGTKWNTFIGAVRFIEYIPVETEILYGDFTLDVINPARSSGVEVVEDYLEMGSGAWIEYDVDVAEDASYYVIFRRENIDPEKNFFIQVTANGKTVNRRTGRMQNNDGSFTFQDEIQLKEGNNTIRIATLGSNSGILSSVLFKKLPKKQYTTSMNSSGGGRTFKAVYKKDVGVDPWVYILEPISKYAPSNAPFITFDVEISKEGYYYPEIARAGVTFAKMYVDGQSFDLHGNAVQLEEKYVSSGSATCTWVRGNDAVYLTEGMHEVTVECVGAVYTSSDEWRLSVGAVRFTEAPEQHIAVKVEAEDAKLFVGELKNEVEFDESTITLVQSNNEDDAKLMSAATAVAVNTPVTDAPVFMEFDVVIKKASDYKLEILKAHDTGTLSEGKISIVSEAGDTIIENVPLNDEHVKEIKTDYLKMSEFGKCGLDVVKLNSTVYLPEGVHKMIISLDADDSDESGENILMFLDAVWFAETVDVSGIEASLSEEAIEVGKKGKVQFKNKDGSPVYSNKLGEVSYKSSDVKIAEVNEDGVITGNRIGNVIITVDVNGEIFELPMSITADNGLVVKSAELDADGNIQITFVADKNEKFDIVAANYDTVGDKKTSLRGLFEKKTVNANGTETTLTIKKPENTQDFGSLYEIYMWEKEDSMIPVYHKIQIK